MRGGVFEGALHGLQLVVLAKAEKPQMPAMVFTGFDDPVLRGEASASGASFHLKPSDEQGFLDRVNAARSPTAG